MTSRYGGFRALTESLVQNRWRHYHPVMAWEEAPAPIQGAYRAMVGQDVRIVGAFFCGWLQRMEDERVSDCELGGVIEQLRAEMELEA